MKDFLWPNISELPYFRGLLRAVESRFYQEFELISPILDLGCGDGHFADSTFENRLDIGLDPEFVSLKEARTRGIFKLPLQAGGEKMPFARGYFGSAISNSVLEHIPDIQPVLNELGRIMSPGSRFYFCVPNHQFNQALLGNSVLRKLHLNTLAKNYQLMFDRIARHYHLDSRDVWEDRLRNAGFSIEDSWHYYSPDSSRVTETGHLFGIPSLISRKLTGRWILVPKKWNLYITERLTRKYYDQEQVRPDGVCTFFIARRTGS